MAKQTTPTYYKIAPGQYYTGPNQKVSDQATIAGLEGGQIAYSTVQKGMESQFTDPIKNNPVLPPPPTPITSSGSANATSLTPTSAELPPPTAPTIQSTYQIGLQTDLERAKSDLESVRKKERDAAIQRAQDLTDQLTLIQSESDPTKRETYAQEQRIIQGQLDAAESASSTLKDDFERRRKVVGELETLLTQGNQLIEQARNKPVSLSVLGKSLSQTIQDVQARAGVLQAVMSGLDGNINMGHSIINNASTTVRSNWDDIMSYNNAVLKLVEAGELNIDKIHTEYAKAEVADAQSKVDNLQKTSDYIKSLMISPETAGLMAEAGVSLTDSVEQINAKMNAAVNQREVRKISNEFASKGYTVATATTPGAVEVKAGDQTLYFKPPVKTTGTDTSIIPTGQTITTKDGMVIDSGIYNSAIQNASLGLPENQRKENQSRMNNYLNVGDIKSAKELIIRTAFAGQTGTQKEDTIKRQNAIDALGTIQTALDEYAAISGDTNIVKGNLQSFSQKLGLAGDPQLAAIGTKITLALQQYRNAVTGAAWGEQETSEYNQIFPSYKNTNKLNGAIIDAMQSSMRQFQEGTLGAYIGIDTYNQIFGSQNEMDPNLLNTEQTTANTLSVDDAYELYLQEINGGDNKQTQSKSQTTPSSLFTGYENPFGAFNFFKK